MGKTCKKKEMVKKNNGNTHVDNWSALCMSIGKGGEGRGLVSATTAVITGKAIN